MATASKPPQPKAFEQVVELGGGWVLLSTKMSTRDLLLMLELNDIDRSDSSAMSAMFPDIMKLLERHTLRFDLPAPGTGGDPADILAQPPDVLTGIFQQWRMGRDNDALPKDHKRGSAARS